MTKQDQETILNSPTPNQLAVAKSNSEWPWKLIKVILLLIFLGLMGYYFFK